NLAPFYHFDASQCNSKALHPINSEGKVIIAGLFSLFNYYCTKVYDSHCEDEMMIHISKYLQLINFGQFDTILSDRLQFSSLYQTASKDTSLSYGIVILMVHFSWTWVGLVLIDGHNGAEILSQFRREMDRNRVCVAFVELIPDNWNNSGYNSRTIHRQILKSSANVVILYDVTQALYAIILYLGEYSVTCKVWIMKTQWDTTTDVPYFIFDPFHGSLIFEQHHAEISDFRKFIQTYNPSKYPEDHILALLWNRYFNCSFSGPDCKILVNCLPNASLEMLPGNALEKDMTEESYNVYNSVYAVAHSLHEMTVKQVEIHGHENRECPAMSKQMNKFCEGSVECLSDIIIIKDIVELSLAADGEILEHQHFIVEDKESETEGQSMRDFRCACSVTSVRFWIYNVDDMKALGTISSECDPASYCRIRSPKDTFLSHGIVNLMVHFSWTWVGLVLMDDHNGAEILSQFRRDMDRNRVCVAFVEMIPDRWLHSGYKSRTSHRQILKSSANVVILYDVTQALYAIILYLGEHSVTCKVWIMKTQWDITTDVPYFIFDPFHGSLIFEQHHAEISDFRKFIQTYSPSKYPEDHILALL
ncbi:hypothetical protein STEG23_026603, partial [Scotinomys teguina]